MWVNGGPLVFQQFNQYYYGRDTLSYDCSFSGLGVIDAEERCVNITNIKKLGKANVQGITSQHNKCMLMLLSNLAEPDWISIPCKQKFLYFVMCVKKDTFKKDPKFTDNTTNIIYCHIFQIIAHGDCYSFVWHTLEKSLLSSCARVLGSTISMFNMKTVLTIFDAIMPSRYTPLIVFKDKNDIFYQAMISWKDHKITFEHAIITQKYSPGYNLCKFKGKRKGLKMLIFICKEAGYILINYVCDGQIDCPNDKSDESDCIWKSKEEYIPNIQHWKCPPLYQTSKDKYCTQFIKNAHKNKQMKRTMTIKKHFKCNDGYTINHFLVNDLIPDCGPSAEDEPLLKILLFNQKVLNLCKPSEIPCKDGHIKCYNFTDICIFRLNYFYHLTPCRNGANLQNCKQFQCNSMFKCQDSYCVPWIYVCDGKWDCPEGDDEHRNPVCGNKINCVNMYKCKHRHIICIQLGNICDSNKNCPNGDDEMLCELVNQVCPSVCQCLSFAIRCKNFDLNVNVYLLFNLFLLVDLYNSSFPHKVLIHESFTQVLILSQNSITDACLLERPNSILHFDLSSNLVWNIKKNCFIYSKLLFTLILRKNIISHLSMYSFFNLLNLRLIDLSDNPISFIPNYSFSNLPQLTLLNITLISNIKIGIIMFENIKINPIIINTNYYITCISPINAICTLYPPWYVSCHGILPNKELKTAFLLIVVCILIINFCSIYIQFIYQGTTKAFVFTSVAININDLIFGMYLVVILAADTFLLKSLYLSGLWKSHFLCYLSFAIFLWFAILGQFLLIFMSISRYMVVSYPLKTKFKQVMFTLKYIIILYSSSFTLSLLVTLIFKQMLKSIPMDLCLPFVDPTNSILLTKVITWLVVISQSVSIVIIATMYILIYEKTKISKITFRRNNEKRFSSMIVQLVLITCSNILCWFPTNIIYVAAMLMPTYPIDIVLWTIITVLPCNSIINPLVFIISTLKKKHTNH